MQRPTKNPRQARILQILNTQDVSTQNELVEALQKAGMMVTQATVSRDIKELGIIKVATVNGQKYIPMTQSGESASGRFMRVFNVAVVSIDVADCFIVVKTLPGMAQGAAAALDSMRLDQIIGTIAGDDTIFAATHSKAEAREVYNQLLSASNIEAEEMED